MEDAYEQILQYWFDDNSDLPTKNEMRKWFLKSKLYDSIIKKQFEKIYQSQKAANALDDQDNSTHALAKIILFDQFSRHIYRNSCEPFIIETKLAEYVLQNIGCLDGLPLKHALFFLMPLQHSENIDSQNCFKQMWKTVQDNHEKRDEKEYQIFFCKIKNHSKNHRKLIKRFGRFPKRNLVLRRVNTGDEELYLKYNPNGFY